MPLLGGMAGPGSFGMRLAITDGFSKNLSKYNNSLTKSAALSNKLKTASKKLGMALTAMSAASVAAIALTTRSAAKFESQMADVSTMLDRKSLPIMKRYSKEILNMSVTFGESTETLSKGLYDILSASIAPQHALNVLETSAKAAAAGLTDTGIAADAITTILNSYGMAADQASNVSDKLFAVVVRGKTNFAALAPSIGNVAATASIAGLSLDELGATIATVTRAGISTEETMTAIRGILLAFIKPTDEAKEAAKEFGLELSSTTLRTEGLKGVMELLTNATAEQLAAIFPNVRGLKGMAAALQDTEGYAKDLELQLNATGLTQEAFNKQTNTLTFTLNQLKQGAIALGTQIGMLFKPFVTEQAEKLKNACSRLNEVFAAMTDEQKTAIAKMILMGTAFTGLTGIFLMLAPGIVSALGMILSPIGLITLAVVGLALLWATKWDAMKEKSAELIDVIGKVAVGGFKWIGNKFADLGAWIKENAGKMWDYLGGKLWEIGGIIGGLFINAYTWLINKFVNLKNWLSKNIPDILAGIVELPGLIGGLFLKAYTWLIGKFTDAWDWISKNIPSILAGIVELPGLLGGLFISAYTWLINKFKDFGAWLKTNMPKVLSGIIELGGIIGGLFLKGYTWLINKFKDFGNWLKTNVPEFLTKVIEFPGIIGGLFVSTWKFLSEKMTSIWDSIVAWFNKDAKGKKSIEGKTLVDKIETKIGQIVSDISKFLINLPDPAKWIFRIGTKSVEYGVLGYLIWSVLKGMMIKVAPRMLMVGLLRLIIPIGIALLGIDLLDRLIKSKLGEEKVKEAIDKYAKEHPLGYKLFLSIEEVSGIDILTIAAYINAEWPTLQEQVSATVFPALPLKLIFGIDVPKAIKDMIDRIKKPFDEFEYPKWDLKWKLGKLEFDWEDIKRVMAEKVQAIKDWWSDLWKGFKFELPDIKIPEWLKFWNFWKKDAEETNTQLNKVNDTLKITEQKMDDLNESLDKTVSIEYVQRLNKVANSLADTSKAIERYAHQWGIYKWDQIAKQGIAAVAADFMWLKSKVIRTAYDTPTDFGLIFVREFLGQKDSIQKAILEAVAAEDFKKALSLIGGELGSIVATGSSPGGILGGIQESMPDVQDELVKRMLKMADSVAATSMQFQAAMKPIIDVIKSVIQKIMDEFKKSGNTTLQGIGNTMQSIIDMFDSLFAEIKPPIKGVGEVVTSTFKEANADIGKSVKTALTQIEKDVKKHEKFMNSVIKRLKQSFSSAFDKISNMASDLLGPVGELLSGLVGGIYGVGKAIVKGDITSALSSFLNVIDKAIDTFIELIRSSEGYKKLQESLKPIINSLSNAFGKLFEPLIPLANTLRDIFQPYIDAVSNSMKMLGESLKYALQPILEAITPLIKIWAEEVKNSQPIIKEFWKLIADFLSPIIRVIINIFKQMTEGGYSFRNLMLGLISLIKAILPIWQLLINVVGFVVQIANAILIPVLNILGGLFQLVGSILSGLVYLIKQIWNAFALAVESIVRTATLGLVTVSLPRLEKGGLITDELKNAFMEFQKGGEVPAILHEGELVIPKPITNWIKEAVRSGKSGGSYQAGGLVTKGSSNINFERGAVVIRVQNLNTRADTEELVDTVKRAITEATDDVMRRS